LRINTTPCITRFDDDGRSCNTIKGQDHGIHINGGMSYLILHANKHIALPDTHRFSDFFKKEQAKHFHL